MKKKFFIMSILLIISLIIGCITIVDNKINKIEKLYLSNDYFDVCDEYGKLFNSSNYEEFLSVCYNDSYNKFLLSYQTKYLTSLLYIDNVEEYSIQFEKFALHFDEENFSNFLIYLYDAINREKNSNEDRFKKVIELLYNQKLDFNNQEFYLLYESFVCFLSFSIDEVSIGNRIDFLKENSNESFEFFWDQECLKYCSSLLLNRHYDIFVKVFSKAYGDGRFFTTKSIAYMINQLGCDNEQLNIISVALTELANKTDKKNVQESLKILSDLSKTKANQSSGTQGDGSSVFNKSNN